MVKVATNPIDAVTRHQVYLGRYSTSIAHRLIALLNRVDADLMAQITKAIERQGSTLNIERLDKLLASERALLSELYQEVGKELRTDLKALAKHESAFNLSLLNGAAQAAEMSVSFAAVAPNQVYAAAMARPFQGTLLREALKGIETGTAIRIRDSIRMGIVEGRTTDQIIRGIRGTRAAGYADGLLEWPRRHIESMVRTAVAHTANVTRQMTYEANDDLVDRWMFVSTLDSRTTIQCAALSGKVFKIGQGPQPPRHYNCRSTSVPLLKGQTKLYGSRASKDGPVDANLTFSAWLKKQPRDVQDDVLGATRAKLWRDGQIELQGFVDARGNVLTLEQLQKKDASLFEGLRLAA